MSFVRTQIGFHCFCCHTRCGLARVVSDPPPNIVRVFKLGDSPQFLGVGKLAGNVVDAFIATPDA